MVTMAPSTATGRQFTMSGFVGGWALRLLDDGGPGGQELGQGRVRGRRGGGATRRRGGRGRGADGARRSSGRCGASGVGAGTAGPAAFADDVRPESAVARRQRAPGWRRSGVGRRWCGRDRHRRRRRVGLDRLACRAGWRWARDGSRASCAGRRIDGRSCREHRQLQLEAEAADAGPVRVDGDQPTAGVGEGGRVVPGRVRVGGRRDELDPDGLDRLVEQRPDVTPALVELVEQGDARRAVAADEVVDERLDDLGVGEAEEVANGRLVDPVGCRGQELVQHRLGVAHPTGGETGDEVDRGRIGLATVGGEDAAQLALDLRHGQTADVVTLEPRQDGRGEGRRLGRGEHEDDEVGRFLERLQERVPGVLGDLVRLVEDVDLAPQVARRIRQALAQVTDRVDAAIAGGVDLDQVEGRPLTDRDARRAGVAGVAVAQVGAVDGLGEDPGERRLARPARTDEQDGVADPVGPDGVPQRLDDGFLADDLGERLGPPAAIDGLVRDGRRHDLLRSGRTREVEMPCTLRRPERSRAHHDERLGPGRSAAPDDDRLVLLPSGPDTVRGSPLRGTRSSTSRRRAASENGDLGRGFSPAGADCRYRAPLVPRLARLGKDTPCLGLGPAGEWRRGRDSNPRRVSPNRISSAAP